MTTPLVGSSPLGDFAEMADELGELALQGPTLAVRGLFLASGEDAPPVVGEHCGGTGADGLPLAVVRTTGCGSGRSCRSTMPAPGRV